jgi:hypothetical protein
MVTGWWFMVVCTKRKLLKFEALSSTYRQKFIHRTGQLCLIRLVICWGLGGMVGTVGGVYALWRGFESTSKKIKNAHKPWPPVNRKAKI